MLKISDILKKSKTKQTKKEKAAENGRPETKNPVPEILPRKQIDKDAEKAHEPVKHAASAEEVEGSDQLISLNKEIVDIYRNAIEVTKDVMSSFGDGKSKLIQRASEVVEEIIGVLRNDANKFMLLFYQEYFAEKGYLYQHAVNVCILSLRIGMRSDYDHKRLALLGLAALLHDIGLSKFDRIISQPRRFDEQDYEEVKKHPLVGQDVLKKFAENIDLEIFEVIRQEHERLNGTGYPYGLKADAISEYAKIIGLVDTYEAMVHSRPYRSRLEGMEAMKELVKQKDAFDRNLLKHLINDMGIFCVGLFVELNTKEIGVVAKQNIKMPLRPLVNITHDAEGHKLEKQKIIDLARNCSIYIKNTVSIQDLK
ncbi:MAG: HD domain-containing protein [Candidatus Omnitrophica bacterium]|nr:HD domain-containing protein [Candidatus Omnitrophota bacterium]